MRSDTLVANPVEASGYDDISWCVYTYTTVYIRVYGICACVRLCALVCNGYRYVMKGGMYVWE